MNPDFIRVKETEGTLLLSQTTRNHSCRVTTKEIILQRPHCTYHILFDDIISMVPHEVPSRSILLPTPGNSVEKVQTNFATDYYKIRVEKVRIYNRSGIHETGETDFIMPLHPRFFPYVQKYSNLTAI